jgi:hypothetical protein
MSRLLLLPSSAAQPLLLLPHHHLGRTERTDKSSDGCSINPTPSERRISRENGTRTLLNLTNSQPFWFNLLNARNS